jgi:hypothetical protein
MENVFIPLKPNIAQLRKFWTKEKQTKAEDRAGNFNLELYFDYLNVINEGFCEPVKTLKK